MLVTDIKNYKNYESKLESYLDFCVRTNHNGFLEVRTDGSLIDWDHKDVLDMLEVFRNWDASEVKGLTNKQIVDGLKWDYLDKLNVIEIEREEFRNHVW